MPEARGRPQGRGAQAGERDLRHQRRAQEWRTRDRPGRATSGPPGPDSRETMESCTRRSTSRPLSSPNGSARSWPSWGWRSSPTGCGAASVTRPTWTTRTPASPDRTGRRMPSVRCSRGRGPRHRPGGCRLCGLRRHHLAEQHPGERRQEIRGRIGGGQGVARQCAARRRHHAGRHRPPGRPNHLRGLRRTTDQPRPERPRHRRHRVGHTGRPRWLPGTPWPGHGPSMIRPPRTTCSSARLPRADIPHCRSRRRPEGRARGRGRWGPQ